GKRRGSVMRLTTLLAAGLMIAIPSFVPAMASPSEKAGKTALTLTLPSDTYVPTETTLATQVGETYLIEVTGTYTYAPGGRIADAEFAFDPDTNAWLEELPGVVNQGFNLDVLINGVPQDWLGSADGRNYHPHTFSQ